MSPQQDEPSKPVKIDIIQDDLKVIEFDEVFDYTGHFGLYQLMVFCVLGLSTFQIGVHNIIATFLIAEVPAWCEVPRLKNFSYEQQTYIAIPYTNDKEEEFSKCEYYDLPWDDYTDEELVTWNRTAMTSQAEVTECDRGWVYDRHELSSTIITEWDLVCDKSWIAPLTITISLSAVFFGSFTWGSISDKFGRAPTFTIGNMITTVAGIAAVYSPNIIVFNILRLMSMFGANGSLMPGFVMVTETFGPRHRTWGGICFSMFFSLGFSILPWVAYFVRDFRMLLLTMTAPSAAIVCAYWILPESPRWLLSQGRQEEGMQILRQICTINNTHLPDNVVITVQIGICSHFNGEKNRMGDPACRSQCVSRQPKTQPLNSL